MSDRVTPDQVKARLRDLRTSLERCADDLDPVHFYSNVLVAVCGTVHLFLASLAAGFLMQKMLASIRSLLGSNDLLRQSEMQRSLVEKGNKEINETIDSLNTDEMKEAWEKSKEVLNTENIQKLLKTNKKLMEEIPRLKTPETMQSYLEEFNKNITIIREIDPEAVPVEMVDAFKIIISKIAPLTPLGPLAAFLSGYGLPIASLVSYIVYCVVPLLHTMYVLVKIDRELEKFLDLRETILRTFGNSDQQISAELDSVNETIEQLKRLRAELAEGIPEFYDSVSNIFQQTMESVRTAAAAGPKELVTMGFRFIWQVASKLLFAVIGSKKDFTATTEAIVAAAAGKKSDTGRELRRIAYTCLP